MYINKKIFLNFLLLFMFAGFAGCQSGSEPGLRHGRHWLEQHFTNAVYKDLVEVVDVELVEAVEETYLEGQYLNMKLQATIDIKDDYVISRLYTYNSFEVSEQWSRNYEAQMTAAQSEAQKDRIRNTFDTRAFNKGSHEIMVYLEYILMDGTWKLFSSNIDALSLE